MIEFANKFLASLTDSELEFFQSAAWKENEKRAAAKRAAFGSGLPKLTETEKRLSGYAKIEAIKAYRLRVGCSLKEAKDEVEDYLAKT